MPQVKAAMMVSPAPLRVATTSGHTINFEAGVERFVPGLAVRECAKYGAKETKRFRGTDIGLPGVGTRGQINSQLQTLTPRTELVEEVALSDVSTSPEPSRRNDVVKDEPDILIGKGILAMIDEADPEDWTGEAPRVAALQKRVDGISVTASLRDRAFAKLERGGELPDNWRNRMGFGGEEAEEGTEEEYEDGEYEEDAD